MSIFAKTYTQGNYYPKHPEKCLNTNGKLGNKPAITYRSSWELKFMRFCDKYESVLEWGSEVLKIPYISEVDGKQHTYITDFYFVCRENTGKVVKYILELKPKCQIARLDEHGEVIFPEPPKTKTQKAINSWQERCKVLRTNNSKWTAARKWCNANGYIFKVISEEEIGINY